MNYEYHMLTINMLDCGFRNQEIQKNLLYFEEITTQPMLCSYDLKYASLSVGFWVGIRKRCTTFVSTWTSGIEVF